MDTIGHRRITDTGRSRLPSTEPRAGRDLEDWIEHDPALLERGLVVVGRQVRLERASPVTEVSASTFGQADIDR
jgi:hypothetical protein